MQVYFCTREETVPVPEEICDTGLRVGEMTIKAAELHALLQSHTDEEDEFFPRNQIQAL